MQRVPGFVRGDLPGCGCLEHLYLSLAGQPVRHDSKVKGPRRGAPECVEVNKGVRVDVEAAVLAPDQITPRPELRRVLCGVGRLEHGGHPPVKILRRPELQSLLEDNLAVGAAFHSVQWETLFVWKHEI